MVEKCFRHGKEVYCHSYLVGMEDKYEICAECSLYKPYNHNNCSLSKEALSFGLKNNIVVVIWECSNFVPKE